LNREYLLANQAIRFIISRRSKKHGKLHTRR
jgi:hypothetical protein